MTEMTSENKEKVRKYHLTVGGLKKFLAENDYPDDALVAVQLIDDKYYRGGIDISGQSGYKDSKKIAYPEGSKSSEWPVIMKKDYHYYSMVDRNKEMADEVERRKNGEESEYPDIENPSEFIVSDETLLKFCEPYHPAWCCVNYTDEPDVMFIDLHY